MSKLQQAVNTLIPHWQVKNSLGYAYAPSNIALCKYWGKRDNELNIPVTSSLSMSLDQLGTRTRIELTDHHEDEIILNQLRLKPSDAVYQRISSHLNLFRGNTNLHFRVNTEVNIPIAAGLASSASGYGALTLALDDLFQWQLSKQQLSLLARLGSGSACRSIWNGFVEWQPGTQSDGMDSFATPLELEYPELELLVILISKEQKPISSRSAMLQTLKTSTLYQAWPAQVEKNLKQIKTALREKNFELLGQASEQNALAMHATMIASQPPICYSTPETMTLYHRIWKLRKEGLPIYFTQDAGPNLKILVENKNKQTAKAAFPGYLVLDPKKPTEFSRPWPNEA